MSQISDYSTELILVVVVGAIIGAIFLGNILSAVQGESGKQAEINSTSQMQKLILYDAMIAYGCDVGGQISDTPPTSKFWGDWETMNKYADDPGTINFDELNASMPRVFKGLPCYGTGSTLPDTGTAIQQRTSVSKEWRDDQEGRYSRIMFETTDDVTLPKCFVHYTADTPVEVEKGIVGQYHKRDADTEVTNSWFLMSKQNEHSVYKPGPDDGLDIDCERIADSNTVNPDDGSVVANGPAMNVEVLDDTVQQLHTSSGQEVTHPDFDPNIDAYKFELPEGTKGYVQTNTGCVNQNPIHSRADPPGKANKEFKSDTCDNKLHPFIVITSTP
ncbi:hypothetical protein GLT81_00105 [Nanohaloarchaea archaeon]|nr:hypothetical protein [Candidatus Nanohaloarchaea archaeon]